MGGVMNLFYMMAVTLSSLTSPSATFLSRPAQWDSQAACVKALPRMGNAVTRLIQYDATALELFGTVAGGPPDRSHFVSAMECWPTTITP